MRLNLICILFLVSVVNSQPAQDSSKLEIRFFGSATCGECLQIKENLLKPLQDSYSSNLKVDYYDIENGSDLSLLIKMEQEYGVTNNSAQTLFFPDTFLTGFRGHNEFRERL